MSGNILFFIFFSGLLLVCIGRAMSDISTENSGQMTNLKQEFNTLKKGISDVMGRLNHMETLISDHFLDFKPPVEPHLVKEPKVHRDCKAALEDGWKKSGVYTIHPNGTTEMDVYCDQVLDGGGWIVFQRRLDGSEDFYRNWADYKAGFGDLSGEFWLGNDNLHQLTKGRDHQLKFELHISGKRYTYADYTDFFVEDEAENYKAHIYGYSGGTPPGHSFRVNGLEFSTKDRDKRGCATSYVGGWWYGPCPLPLCNCHASNLNGLYGSTVRGQGLNWRTWKGYSVPLSSTKMMIRRKN